MKYMVTDEKRTLNGKTVYRIQSTMSFQLKNSDKMIEAGQKGGWVESEENLNQSDISWIDEHSIVAGNTYICGNSSYIMDSQIDSIGLTIEDSYVGRTYIEGEGHFKNTILDACEIYGKVELYDSTCFDSCIRDSIVSTSDVESSEINNSKINETGNVENSQLLNVTANKWKIKNQDINGEEIIDLSQAVLKKKERSREDPGDFPGTPWTEIIEVNAYIEIDGETYYCPEYCSDVEGVGTDSNKYNMARGTIIRLSDGQKFIPLHDVGVKGVFSKIIKWGDKHGEKNFQKI